MVTQTYFVTLNDITGLHPPIHDKGSVRFQTGIHPNRQEAARFLHHGETKNTANRVPAALSRVLQD